jgi:hypothetical protein
VVKEQYNEQKERRKTTTTTKKQSHIQLDYIKSSPKEEKQEHIILHSVKYIFKTKTKKGMSMNVTWINGGTAPQLYAQWKVARCAASAGQ